MKPSPNGPLRHSSLIMRRQLAAAIKDPGPSFIAPMMPPILMLVVFTSIFDPIAQASGYDTSAFNISTWDAFVAPGVIVLVALLGAGYSSSSLASDLRSGYIERMSLAGVPVLPHLVGRLAFEAVRLVPGIAIAVGVSFLLGAQAPNGAAGIIILIVLVALLGAAFSGVFYIVAIATRDPQTPFTMAPLGLPLAFLSSALVPLAIMPTWSRTLARANPVSVIVDAARHAMIGDMLSPELLSALLVLIAWTLISVGAAWLLLAKTLKEA